MLMLLFYIKNDRYALESKRVVEVVPKVVLKTLHHAPDYIAGVFNYRNRLVPVIDLCRLIHGTPCRPLFSSRIILVNYDCNDNSLTESRYHTQTQEANASQPSHILGLMAERVTDTFRKQETEVFVTGIKVDTAPYLGEMINDAQGMIQCLQLDNILPERERILLPQQQSY
ncbi:chemotaxis protein CheW [Scytonema sp. UIC 10036]|uniref:chemotaxis protein CheW n=1 Tax=Scytonema sp. UIC 10036 TaxID=2304196 RepID=UPI0012DA4443|nr:chemotaxis protein CheW [Scytonema sp. UIC 10036]MUG91088.1 chemotaxis protein CheW [Scytonema sp. UIC 10036]